MKSKDGDAADSVGEVCFPNKASWMDKLSARNFSCFVNRVIRLNVFNIPRGGRKIILDNVILGDELIHIRERERES